MMDNNYFNANWNYPTSIRNGNGRISELTSACTELGITAPLLITDPGLANMGIVQNCITDCLQAGLKIGLFDKVKSNPTGQNVSDGVKAYHLGEHDGVIAFGGGSALDAAKAVALMIGQQGSLWDYEDVGDNWTKVNTSDMASIIAVPTTSGTGSEVGRASVITDEDNHIKRIIFHPKMLPEIVILDAELTLGLPKLLTASTGMDALSHALEAYCASGYHPMAKGVAIEAIRLIKNYLPRACANGKDKEARTQLMVASTMGSMAFQRGLGAMHALAHPLGAFYDSHHGLLNAILMPYVLVANQSAITEDIGRLSRYLELEDASFNGFLQWIISLRTELEIPNKLSDIGINTDRAVEIGKMAFRDPCASSNPIAMSENMYQQIFIAAVNGEL
ncbi:iron-containing alcohol dehydrogenase [Colwellia sp. E150_009]